MKVQEKNIDYKKGRGYEVRLLQAKKSMPHYHTHDLEIICCLHGSVHISFAHEQVVLQENEIVAVDYMDIHHLYAEEENLLLVFHLDLHQMDMPWKDLKYMLFSCESVHLYPYQMPAFRSVVDLMLALACANFQDDALSGEMPDKLTGRLLSLLVHYFNWFNYENQDDSMNPELQDRFYRILRYCSEHYQERISLAQLAEQEHISRNYFSQFIGNTVFQSFGQMVQYIRCYNAEHMLLCTDLPNMEISYACGFSDPKYFYAAFKTWWGCTPGEHRQAMQRYMASPADVKVLSSRRSVSILRDYITRWHLYKCCTEETIVPAH